MRRPRSKLQVSTFPFLAVLLCAMGALLLLLFIMDRRAKIAAQHTVSDAVAERKKRTQEEEAARKAEWEKATALLHQSLLEKQGEVAGDAGKIQLGLSDADQKLAAAQTQHGDIASKIQAESAQIAFLQSYLARQNAGLKEVDQKETKSKADLLEATKELAELELAVRKLKALRERDKATYSVVPYRGKRGDLRTPIYVECLRGGVIFHPEKKLLDNWRFTADAVRTEVERRTGPLAIEKSVWDKKNTPAQEHKGPYVLFLVRPNGIAAYYLAQSALKGYQIDFGYELVDEHWVLDFNGDPNANQAPIRVARVPDTRKAERIPGVPVFGNGAIGQGSAAMNGGVRSGPGGVLWNGGATAGPGGSGVGASMNGGAGSGPGGSGVGASLNGGAGSGPGGTASGIAMNGGAGPGPGGPTGVPGGLGLPAIGVLPPPGAGGGPGISNTPPPGLGYPAASGIDTGIPSKGPAFVPVGRQQAPMPIASSGAGDPGPPFSGGTSPRPDGIAPLGVATNPSAGGPLTPGAAPGGTGANYGGPAPGGTSANYGGPSSGGSAAKDGTPAPAGTGEKGISASGSSTGEPGEPGIPGSINMPNSGGGAGGGNGAGSTGSPGQGSGGAGEPGGNDGMPGPRPTPFQSFGGGDGPRKPPTPASPLSKLLGNKDFIITIECYNDHVTVSPSGLQYRWNAGNAAANDQALTQTVTNLIARRQASVRPGEPPYRPVLRFQVAADGYSTFYRAYPLLEHLHVAWTKENIRD